MGKIDNRLQEIDSQEKTANGVLYHTRKQAREVRLRSFEGKEYKTADYANLGKSEVENIRVAYEEKDIIQKYHLLEHMKIVRWETEEASKELEKLESQIRKEYEEMRKKVSNFLSLKSQ